MEYLVIFICLIASQADFGLGQIGQHVQSHLPIPIEASGEAIPIPIHSSHDDVISLPLRAPPPSPTPIQNPNFPLSPNLPVQGSGSSIALTDDEIERLERERTRNVVRLAATDQLNSEIITNRTRAYLSCESGEMIVKINFSVPFRGVAYANYDRSSNCKFYGDGSQYYEMRIPLKGCGTKQEAPRLFINNIIFRFHRSLELEEDEIKTIICRYPPPLAPPPTDPIPPIVEPVAPIPLVVPNKLSEIELLLIICALLFLTLLLLGVGCGYYCLKRRNIKIVRKKRHITPAPSDITKTSIIEPIRIPRAAAPPTESSETDYPSESPSDDDGRRTIVSETSTLRQDRYRFENTAFLPEPYPPDIERGDSVSSFPVPALRKPEIIKQDFITTILETENLTDVDEITNRIRSTTTKLYKKAPEPPTYSDAPSLRGSIPDDDDWSHSEIIERTPVKSYIAPPKFTSENMEDTYIDKSGETEITEDITRTRLAVVPAPKILVKKIDDLFVTNISETVTTESIFKETAGRSTNAITNGSSPSGPPRLTEPSGPRVSPSQTRDTRDYSSNVGQSTYQVERTRELLDMYQDREREFRRTDETMRSTGSEIDSQRQRTTLHRDQSSQEVRPNMTTTTTKSTVRQSKSNVILNILDNPPLVEGTERLTTNDRNKWRTVIVTDEVFRSLIIESTTREEYVRISRDIRYESLFERETWETIIRIMTHPSVANLTIGSEAEFNAEWSETLYRVRPERRPKDATGSTRSSWTVDYDLRSITEEDVNFTRLRRESSWADAGLPSNGSVGSTLLPKMSTTQNTQQQQSTTIDVPSNRGVIRASSSSYQASSALAAATSRHEERSSRSYYSSSAQQDRR